MTRLALFGASLLVAATVVTGCSKSQVPSTGTGTLTGYEIGNQEDFGELRKHRPG